MPSTTNERTSAQYVAQAHGDAVVPFEVSPRDREHIHPQSNRALWAGIGGASSWLIALQGALGRSDPIPKMITSSSGMINVMTAHEAWPRMWVD